MGGWGAGYWDLLAAGATEMRTRASSVSTARHGAICGRASKQSYVVRHQVTHSQQAMDAILGAKRINRAMIESTGTLRPSLPPVSGKGAGPSQPRRTRGVSRWHR